MLVLMLPRVSSRVSGFSCGLAVSMGEAAKPFLFARFQLWKLAEVLHEMLVLMLPRVSSRVFGFPVASPCLWGKLQKLSFLEVSKEVVVLFCVAGLALCDIPTGGHKTFATFSHDELQFSWQAQHFGRVYRHFAWQSQHFRSVVLRLFPNKGAEGVFARRCVYIRNRPQPFAWGPYGRAYGKFCRRGPLWRFQTSCCFVSRGRHGTSWHSDVFCNVSKVVLCGRRNTFATFSEDALQFLWQAQHFGSVHRHFVWQAQHFRRVVLRVCKSHWQGCVKWRQGADSVAGVAFCEMCWKLTEAAHETSILR